VYEIRIDRAAAIIDVDLDGTLRAEDMARLGRELQEAIAGLVGREVRIKVDARTLRPVAPEVAEMLRAAQALAIRSGVRRIAELVAGGVVALQLGRVAQESGADRYLRRFVDERAAREWVRETEPPSQRAGVAPASSGRRTSSRALLETSLNGPGSEPPLSPRRTTGRDIVAAPSSSPGSEPPLSPRRTTWRDIPPTPGATPLSELFQGGPTRLPGGPAVELSPRRTTWSSRPDLPAPDSGPGGKPKA
jgi:hypothetical protein